MKYINRDIIHISDFSKDEILHLLDCAEKLKSRPQSNLLRGKILGSCFFEPSTRTRLSFESAMQRLGGTIIGFNNFTGNTAHSQILLIKDFHVEIIGMIFYQTVV